MADLRKAAQMAIEALEKSWNPMVRSAERESSAKDAITALKAALEQQAEPPPEWPLIKNILAEYGLQAICFVAEWKAAQRPWVDLTDEEIESAISDGFARGLDDGNVPNRDVIHYVRVIEAALKEKNSA